MNSARSSVGRLTAARRAVVALPLLLGACGIRDSGPPAPPVASRALPEVIFQTAQNETVATADLKGRAVLAVFWATGCEACAAMRAAGERLYKHAAPDTWFLGVNEDEQRQTWKDYMDRHPSALTEVWDKDHAFRRNLGMVEEPSAVLMDRSGRVRWRSPGWTAGTEAEALALLTSLERERPPE